MSRPDRRAVPTATTPPLDAAPQQHCRAGNQQRSTARNNADWHRLLEICALSGTLICDEDGIYDLQDFNDRLLLGLSVPDFRASLTSSTRV